jgi:hypothetical protein
MKSSLAYNKVTQTIRQVPENYLIAQWNDDQRKWICEPDLAADKVLATSVFQKLMEHQFKYNQNGDEVVSSIENRPVDGDLIAVMNSCVEGYSGEWDSQESSEGFKDMYYLLESVAKGMGIDTTGAKTFDGM